MDEVETWKPVVGYEGLYEVSNMGRIKSLPKAQFKYCRMLTPYINPVNGYCYVNLIKDRKSKGKRLHTLVMAAFNPVDKKYGYDPNFTIDHIDGDKTNNKLTNLEWCTQLENQRRAIRNGLHTYDKQCKKVICLDTGVVYKSITEAAIDVGGRLSGISRACNGKRRGYKKKHYAFYGEQ